MVGRDADALNGDVAMLTHDPARAGMPLERTGM